jgi:hypothetical protein
MKTKTFFIVALSLGIVAICSGQTTSSPTVMSRVASGSSAPYTEGPVWTLTMIRTKAGLSDDYFRQISATVKPAYEAEKSQKIILDYKILQGDAMGPNDYNIVIMVEYPNMAGLDGLRDKTDPILEKVMAQKNSAAS